MNRFDTLFASPGQSPDNLMLEGYRQKIARAFRTAIVPTCTPFVQGQGSSKQRRRTLLGVPIDAIINGDNLLIPTTAQGLLIYEIFLWNGSAAAVNMSLYQGASATGVLLLPVPNFPAQSGLFMGFNGNWEQPHFEIDSGQTFVLNLSTTGPVTGLIKYKIDDGSQ